MGGWKRAGATVCLAACYCGGSYGFVAGCPSGSVWLAQSADTLDKRGICFAGCAGGYCLVGIKAASYRQYR